MSFPFRALASAPFALLALSGLFIAPACSTNSSTTTPAACEDSACKTGNRCIADDAGEIKCRLVCGGGVFCPTNYTCIADKDGTVNYCAAMRPIDGMGAIQPQDKGQWGAHCDPTNNATKKIDGNSDCDGAQHFWCYAKSPTDADGYCTQYDCIDDLDCAQGFSCQTINEAPNALTDKRLFGPTKHVCLKHSYCSPCKTDVDCGNINGIPSHCIAGTDSAKFCSTECSKTIDCAADAQCQHADGAANNVCVPRAGVCAGDGTFCSPCRSDDDCRQAINGGALQSTGSCVQAWYGYSTERFCTVNSGKPCRVVNDKLEADCPKTGPANSGANAVTCATATNPNYPKNGCMGLVQWGTDQQTGEPDLAPACWTPIRKK